MRKMGRGEGKGGEGLPVTHSSCLRRGRRCPPVHATQSFGEEC